MPAAYEAMRDKFHSQGLSLPAAKTKAAKIYNSTHHDAPVTGKAEPTMNKGYQGKTEHYAKGGAVLGVESKFLKTHDEFRDPDEGKQGDSADEDQLYGKSGEGAGSGEQPTPKAKGKSLKPVKPRG